MLVFGRGFESQLLEMSNVVREDESPIIDCILELLLVGPARCSDFVRARDVEAPSTKQHSDEGRNVFIKVESR